MSTVPTPPPAAKPARLPDDPDDLVWLEGGPEPSGQAFPDPPPVLTRCPRCKGPLVVWRGTPVCETCDVVELPADDAWLADDGCGRG